MLLKTNIYHSIIANKARHFIENNIVQYTSTKEAIIEDLIDVKITYDISFPEYFQFHFEGKDKNYRHSYVGNNERRRITAHLNSQPEILTNKWKAYMALSDYYCRDVCRLESSKDYNAAALFMKQHPVFIVKPNAASKGKGVRICNTSEDQSSPESLLKEYRKAILEELLHEDNDLAVFHPKSVNTLRIVTFYTRTGVECCFPVLRMGVGNAIVDNAGAGGILGSLDENGQIISVGDELGHVYDAHPDSNILFNGFKVPFFNDAKELCKEIASKIPENRYCSWDLALVNKRWVLIEGNASGHILWQICSGEGIRNQLEDLYKRSI